MAFFFKDIKIFYAIFTANIFVSYDRFFSPPLNAPQFVSAFSDVYSDQNYDLYSTCDLSKA